MLSRRLVQTRSRWPGVVRRYLSCNQTVMTGHTCMISRLRNHEQRRYLDLHEYQSKQLLHERGVAVQKFKVASHTEEISQILDPQNFGPLPKTRWSGFEEEIDNASEFVVKAQILAGGRGKGKFRGTGLEGGVKLTDSPSGAASLAGQMLNDYLVTKQTGEKGALVEKVMIAEAVELKREFYFAILLDRSFHDGLIYVASPAGGMNIEDVAEKDELLIRKFTVPLDVDMNFDLARRISMAGFDLRLHDQDLIDQCAELMISLHKLFLETDASQIEINPLGVTKERKVLCVDAKIKFDENARFRQVWLDEIEEMNKAQTDVREYAAQKNNLNFIGLDGTIGCLVNGAGLAMATMDIIKLHGGEPANFLDVGGGATASQVKSAFEIIQSDPRVKSIFVNIFGGIMRCDTVAEGVIDAAKSLKLRIPVVIRLEGTRVKEARQLIQESGLDMEIVDDFDQAAHLAVIKSAL